MKVLLISPSYYSNANASYFPLGVAFISSYIKKLNHRAIGLNLNNINSNEHEIALQTAIKGKNIDAIGISGLTVAFNEIDQLIHKIRRINNTIPIILGGGITSVEGEIMMNTLKPDYAVVGEGEIIFSQLLNALEQQNVSKMIRGIWCWDKEVPVYTGGGAYPKQLDSLPAPDLEAFGIREHITLQGKKGQFSHHLIRLDVNQSLPISASRSCPFKCTFCHHAGMNEYKKHSIPHIVDQIASHIKTYGITNFSIYDELFSADKARVIEFCQLLKEQNLNIKWFCQLRMDQLDLPMLQMMHDSGCQYISFGIESGSNTILTSMKKKITKHIIEDAISMVKKAKIGIQGNFLFGDPCETPDTIKESLEFQKKNELFFCDWSAVIPYAGTAIYNHAVKNDLIKDHELFMRSLCNISDYLYKDQINMTQMTDAEYKDWYIYLRELNDINHRKRCAEIIFGEVISRWKSEIKIKCPKCSHKQTLTLTFPFEQTPNGPVLDGPIGVQGMNILCPDCGRKMHLKAIDLPHMRGIYDKFQKMLNLVKEKGEKIIIIPSLDRFAATFLEDINIDDKMVEDVYDTRTFRKDKNFMRKPTKIINKDNISTLQDKIIVILPWIEYKEILSKLSTKSIKPSQIICWNTLFS